MEDNVNHPKHYAPCFKTKEIECIDITRHMSFSLGNAFKYVWRAGSKGDPWKAVEDLSKAEWYLHDYQYSTAQLKEDLTVAKELFILLEREDTLKWRVLRDIVTGKIREALIGVDSLKKEMTPDFVWENDLVAGDFSARKVVEPVYCDDIPFELLEGRNNSPIDPHLILDDPDLANKVEDALKTVREYKQFLETVVQS